MKDFVRRAGILIFLVTLAVSAVAAQEINKDLKSGKVVVRHFLILPAEASITRLTMSGASQAVDEARQTEKRLVESVASVLLGKEYEVLPDPAGEAAEDINLRNSVVTLQNAFNELLPHLQRNSNDVRKGRFTLGDQVLNFTPGASADALVFVRADGMLATGGKKAFAVLVGGPGSDYIHVHLAVVDARTGNVLYYGESSEGGDFFTDREHLNSVALKALTEFPGPRAPGRK
jgi:hypothetical protein